VREYVSPSGIVFGIAGTDLPTRILRRCWAPMPANTRQH
jgi:hypothetical protein